MKRPRSTTQTLDLPVTITHAGAVWCAVASVRMSPRTGRPRVTDIAALERVHWGTAFAFDIRDAEAADWEAIVMLRDEAARLYLEATDEGAEVRA